MATFAWDAALKPQSVSVELRGFARSGGRSLSGVEQTVFSDAGRWEVSFGAVPVHRPEQVRAWRATLARLRAGDVVVLKVPNLSNGRDAYGAAASVTLGANAALRATQLTLHSAALRLGIGQDFSFGDRLYRITQVVSETAADSIWQIIRSDLPWSSTAVWSADDTPVNAYVVKVLPPLRAAVAAGTAARFKDLTLTCKLAEMASGDLSLDLLRFGSPSIAFVEDF